MKVLTERLGDARKNGWTFQTRSRHLHNHCDHLQGSLLLNCTRFFSTFQASPKRFSLFLSFILLSQNININKQRLKPTE